MLSECRLALRINTVVYDPELCSLMEAAAMDLETAGIVLPGTVAFSEVSETEEEDGEEIQTAHMQDDSTLTDSLVKRAIFTYVRMHFGSPPDYERLRESWETQKVQLMHATGYTDYGEAEAAEATGTGDGDGA